VDISPSIEAHYNNHYQYQGYITLSTVHLGNVCLFPSFIHICYKITTPQIPLIAKYLHTTDMKFRVPRTRDHSMEGWVLHIVVLCYTWPFNLFSSLKIPSELKCSHHTLQVMINSTKKSIIWNSSYYLSIAHYYKWWSTWTAGFYISVSFATWVASTCLMMA
jgi:hypothetical protein